MWGLSRGNGLECWRIVFRFNLEERIYKYSPPQPILKVHFEIRPSGALSQDMLKPIEIRAQSANIAGYCLWINIPQACVWTTYFFFGF